MMNAKSQSGFSLVELLIVVTLIALLASILVPAFNGVKALARRASCVASLNTLGRAMGLYHADNKDLFWPGTLKNYPDPGMITYFWGTKSNPVDPRPSPFMQYCDYRLSALWCPSMKWGTYHPQGRVKEPTTTLGYNTWCLDPASYWWDWRRKPKRAIQIPDTSELFVFADAGMVWRPGNQGSFFQNSMHLEPLSGPLKVQPTTHFRHRGTTNALCVDGHAASYGLEGGEMHDPTYNLGFVGVENYPHYDIKPTL